jgi:hypothetical protein
MLDCLIRCNIALLRFAPRPYLRLYDSGVRYDRTREWENIAALYKRGYGDCKSLTAALVAEYYIRGIEAKPVFRSIENWREGRDYHILVMTPKQNGIDKTVFEDPSRKLGMGADELKHFSQRVTY